MVDRLLGLGAEVKVVDKLQLASGSLSWNRKLLRSEEIFRKHGVARIPLEICDLETEKQKFQILATKSDAVLGGRSSTHDRPTAPRCSQLTTTPLMPRSRPGSKIGETPRLIASTLALSTSNPVTSNPEFARMAARQRPSFPNPMTDILIITPFAN
jgi:hypothetical protein